MNRREPHAAAINTSIIIHPFELPSRGWVCFQTLTANMRLAADLPILARLPAIVAAYCRNRTGTGTVLGPLWKSMLPDSRPARVRPGSAILLAVAARPTATGKHPCYRPLPWNRPSGAVTLGPNWPSQLTPKLTPANTVSPPRA
jgi:hypothetical protein